MFPLSTAIAAACSSGSSRTSHFPAPSRIPKPVVVPSSVKATKIPKKRRDVSAVIFCRDFLGCALYGMHVPSCCGFHLRITVHFDTQ